MRAWIHAVVIVCLALIAVTPAMGNDVERERLAALARLYGHVRFFHPSDQVQGLDWGKVMVHGVRGVSGAQDPESLATALNSLFGPIAPTVVITSGELPPRPEPERGSYTYWEHVGVWYGPGSSVYQSMRVGIDSDAMFEESVDPGESLDIELGAGVRARVPLSVATSSGRTLPRPDASELDAWHESIDEVEFGDASESDVRVASTLMLWSAMRHFFPYFDVVDVDWDARLDVFIARALEDQSVQEYFREVCAIMAELEDGHGFVYMSPGLPEPPVAPAARFTIARDGTIMVTRSWNNCPLEHGDIVISVDGRPATEELERWEYVTSGSDHLRRHRALNQFGTSDTGVDAVFVVRRLDGDQERELTLEVARTERSNPFFVQPEFEHPPISEVADGVWLVNLRQLTKPLWDEHLEQIKQARGLILDYRWGGGSDQEINPLKMISHFIDEPVSTTTWEVPGITRPNFQDVEWVTSSWDVHPLEPRLDAEVVFLTAPSIVSFGETVMAFWDHYGLASAVGEPTAGCNGNINRLGDLPSNAVPNFTGMRVRKHDGSVLYGVGYTPDVHVKRTVEQIRSGEDIDLQEAISLILDED